MEILLIHLFSAMPAWAQTYAAPPYPVREPEPRYSQVADPPDDPYEMQSWRKSELSTFRFHIGGAGRIREDEVTPGLWTALDVGRGPAGFRFSGSWLRVGSNHGVAHYTGELTLDLGGRHSWRPVLGAGAGLSRVYEKQSEETGVVAQSLGIGLVRAGIEYRIPVESTDTRAGISAIGMLPAIRSDNAPDLKPWLVLAATVGVGF
ncbi:MAG TPA: hypothetical protein PKW66_02900 [Polyangiaceae bacterium]|nr:hypothetical protein [Polyangiaceae bacterium]